MTGIQAIFGVLSSVFVLIGLLPYLLDIKNKKVHPQILSWTGWGFVTGLGSVAMLSEGFTWGAVIVGTNTVLCFVIAGYAAIKKTGVWQTSTYDWMFFVLGIFGIILWQTFDNPDLAIGCAILADLSFGIPNLIKIYKDPGSETYFVWATATASGLASLLAIPYISFTEIGYPIYLAIYDSTALLLVLYGKKINSQVSSPAQY